MQAYSPSLPVGTQRHYRSAFHALWSIYLADGIKGLFRGARTAMFRTSLGTSVQMPTYFFAKRKIAEKGLLKEESFFTVILSSAAAGAMVVGMPTTVFSNSSTFSVLIHVTGGHHSHKTVRCNILA